jgi:hypothetical protein
MDMKFWFAIAAAMVGIAAFLPYLRDMLARKTRPHAYTWLIWILTQGDSGCRHPPGWRGMGCAQSRRRASVLHPDIRAVVPLRNA